MQISLFDGSQKFKIEKPIRLIELFAGIGSQAKALKNLGVEFEHYRICEFDKYAVASYNAVHGTNFETSDITKITAQDLGIVDTDKYCYIMTYSFPCQDLSNAGLGKGMAKGSGTRSGLLWEVERLLDECSELPNVLLMENVPQVIGQNNIQHFAKWQEKLEKLGYKNKWQVLNAKDFEIPQNRERCFMVSILGDYYYDFPKTIPLKLRLKDMLEDNVDEKYYLSDRAINGMLNSTFNCSILEARTEKDGVIPTLCARDYKDPKLVIEETDKPIKIGHIPYPNSDKEHQSNTFYSTKGICPTIDTCGGGNREPKIAEEIKCEEIQITTTVKVRKYEVDIEKLKLVLKESKQKLGWSIGSIAEYLKRSKTEVEHWFRTDNCFSIPSADVWFELKNLLNIETDEFDKSITEFIEKPNQFESSNRAYSGNGLSPTITATTSPNVVKVADDIKPSVRENYVRDKEKIAKSDKDIFMCDCTSGFNDNKVGIKLSPTIRAGNSHTAVYNNFLIRKLTPKECWRLMGFEDKDIDNAIAIGMSNAQLYKQAGNSIVVNVLMAIFKEML